jgi:2-polyprenyl-6-hydroxyphenyl methylase / 3-demethylubiquinone-9 3-methyltransferase
MNASTPASAPTIDPKEAAHFGALAAEWWDPKGSSAMLHRLNPARLGYIRRQLDAHLGGDRASFRPLVGKRALDVGCGAGLLAEPLARLGAAVTALDAAPENIAAAKLHAEGQGLGIDYRAGGIEQLTGERFDLVTCLEVIEHAADPAALIAGLAKALADDGLLILSTPNRTLLSRLALITIGEGTGRIPKGTHDWSRFLRPEELIALLETAGMRVIDRTGLGLSPGKGFVTGGNEALDYLVTAARR